MKNIFLFIVLVNLFFFPLSATGQSFSADDGSDPIEWKQLPPSIISKAILSRSNKDFEMLTNIVDLQLDGASATFSGNLITLHNLKILSDTTDFDDYISIDYLMDTETLQLIPAHIEITDDLGVYYRDESLFSKDVSIALEMKTTTGDSLVPDTLHNISTSAADEFTMFIEIGTVLTMQVKDPTDDLIIEISKPDGSLYGRNLYRSGSWWYTWGKSFIEKGEYKFRFIPQNNNDSVSLKFGFTNNNRKSLSTISSGDNISTSLPGWGHEYAKYMIPLSKGDLITVSKPYDNDIHIYLIDSQSSGITNVISGEVYTKVYKSDNYYLFIVNDDYENGSSYTGSVTVTPDPNIADYPEFETLRRNQRINNDLRRSNSSIPDQTAIKGETFSLQLSATNNPEKFSATGLPTGLSIDETSGLISGTPVLAGIFPVKVSTENEFGRDEDSFLLTVKDSLVWDVDDNDKWSLPDIIHGLRTITGL